MFIGMGECLSAPDVLLSYCRSLHLPALLLELGFFLSNFLSEFYTFVRFEVVMVMKIDVVRLWCLVGGCTIMLQKHTSQKLETKVFFEMRIHFF